MKKFNAKKYFMLVIPSAILFEAISYFFISSLITSPFYLRFFDTVILMCIFLGCLYLSRENKEN